MRFPKHGVNGVTAIIYELVSMGDSPKAFGHKQQKETASHEKNTNLSIFSNPSPAPVSLERSEHRSASPSAKSGSGSHWPSSSDLTETDVATFLQNRYRAFVPSPNAAKQHLRRKRTNQHIVCSFSTNHDKSAQKLHFTVERTRFSTQTVCLFTASTTITLCCKLISSC